MKRILFLVLIALAPVGSYAQLKSQARPVNMGSLLSAPAGMERKAAALLGLDASRLQIYQSYEMSHLSLGGQSITQGLYLNTMIYDFKFPLQIALQWGVRHQPFASSETAPFYQNGPFVSGAQLSYQPSKNLLLQLNYSQVPYRQNLYGYRYSPSFFDW